MVNSSLEVMYRHSNRCLHYNVVGSTSRHAYCLGKLMIRDISLKRQHLLSYNTMFFVSAVLFEVNGRLAIIC